MVQFGLTATSEREDGRCQTYRPVGEDEGDPARELISYASPLGRALLGKALGEEGKPGADSLAILMISA